MLILLPPSEGKAEPTRGAPLDLASLSSPVLNPTRERVLGALVAACSGDPTEAAATLGLGATQQHLALANAVVRDAPTARADRIYTGVLYDALDLPGLSAAARRRAASRVGIVSAAFGLLRPTDRVPAYRLAGDVTLPGLGPVAGAWREVLGDAVLGAAGRGLVVDLRSGTYAAFWRPPAGVADHVATVRVLHEQDGRRKVVSHFNKATKGRLVRALLEDGRAPRSPAALADLLQELGWHVEEDPGPRGTRLDVVVSAL